MALRQRLAFVLLAIGSLLCIYVLVQSLGVYGPSDAAYSPGRENARSADILLPGTPEPAQATTSAAERAVGASEKPRPSGGVAKVTAESEVAAGATTAANDAPPPTRQAKPVATVTDFIGDTYDLSGDFPLQQNCSESVRGRMKGEFGDGFLTNILVFQCAKHATPEQYDRLKHYSGTYGWQDVDSKTWTEALSVLNSSVNCKMFDGWERRGSGCIRCAVVGNGGILKNSGKGSEIDGHNYVFRTNGAVIKGYEQDVGSRTTHYTFSTNTMQNSLKRYAHLGYTGPPKSEETRYLFLPDHDRDYLLAKAVATHTPVEKGPERSNKPPAYFGENVSAEKLKLYHPDFIRYIRNRFLRSKTLDTEYRHMYRPSTGAVMLMAAVHTCDQVSAYGFMTPDYSSYSDHYYDIAYHRVSFFINHDLRMEMLLWQRLHKAGLIKLYMGH